MVLVLTSLSIYIHCCTQTTIYQIKLQLFCFIFPRLVDAVFPRGAQVKKEKSEQRQQQLYEALFSTGG
jgi:hypothetical protein